MAGRFWCVVDSAGAGHVVAGDSLTTSNTLGHDMKVVNYPLASGSIIGKAMTSMDSETGMVLVLVSLQ